MSSARSERLMKLLIMLLVQRQYVGKDRIREALYPGTGDEAFERMFERDKDELRSLGVPVETGTHDAYFDDAQGYRVRPDAFELPEVVLTSAEAAVLRVATQVWQTTRLADATRDGLRKLTAGGAPVALGDDAASDLGVRIPLLGAEEPSFDVFVEAAHVRSEVVFDYRGTQDVAARRRRLQTWGVVRHGGRWYAVGRDPEVPLGPDEDGRRVFRLSRVVGQARTQGRRDAFDVPADVDVREIARRIAPPARSGAPAVLLVRQGAGFALRRDAAEVTPGVRGPDGGEAWDRVRLPWSGEEVARTVLEHGADVVVEEPPALRDQVVTALREIAGPGETPGPGEESR
ncbi:WYL domain-containing protein [Nocardioides zeae]|uniref:WYL domain-containing protein n=1 Tax=Nocardioides imazamoxiresistens TaxID=3231893 RepID=A0ABU3PSW2_9ACTN|nr:WYL domain-containing protein [Nocardioides zeae]MDT9592323.1 WYL domain-containing protein [Nocardioides zeae]